MEVTNILLGYGKTARVYLARDELGKEYAVRVIDKTKLSMVKIRLLLRELDIIRQLEHPHIIKVYDIMDNPVKTQIFMEKFTGDLASYLKANGVLNELNCRIIFHQLVSAISYLHSKFIVHGDVKLKNILFNNNSDLTVVISDFDLSVIRKPNDPYTSGMRGTPLYFSPEALNGARHTGYPSDIYALGICLFMLYDDPDNDAEPYHASGLSLTNYLVYLERHRMNRLMLLDNQSLVNLLKGMLDHNFEHRLTIKEIINHPWME